MSQSFDADPSLVEDLTKLKTDLLEQNDNTNIKAILEKLKHFNGITAAILKSTGIGKAINDTAKKLIAEDEDTKETKKECLAIVTKWKALVSLQQRSSVDASSQKSQTSANGTSAPARSTSAPATGMTPLRSALSTGSLKSNGSSSGLQPLSAMKTSMVLNPSVAAGLDPKSDAYKRTVMQEKLRVALTYDENDEIWKELFTDITVEPVADLAKRLEEELWNVLVKDVSNQKAYQHQIRAILFNLRDPKNKDFKINLRTGEMNVTRAPSLTPDDMASDAIKLHRKDMRDKMTAELETDYDKRHGKQNLSSTIECGKCKKFQCSFYQMQTRSSDEPMTTFVTCLNCGNRFKFC